MARKRIIYKHWDDLPLLMEIADVSVLTGLGPERIRQLCVAGEIPAFKVGGSWRVDKNDLQQWIDSRKTRYIGA